MLYNRDKNYLSTILVKMRKLKRAYTSDNNLYSHKRDGLPCKCTTVNSRSGEVRILK